jgi:hypothetical protein
VATGDQTVPYKSSIEPTPRATGLVPTEAHCHTVPWHGCMGSTRGFSAYVCTAHGMNHVLFCFVRPEIYCINIMHDIRENILQDCMSVFENAIVQDRQQSCQRESELLISVYLAPPVRDVLTKRSDPSQLCITLYSIYFLKTCLAHFSLIREIWKLQQDKSRPKVRSKAKQQKQRKRH